MDAASENKPRKETHRLRILPWLTGLFIALALYVLSIGPAFNLCMRGRISLDVFNGVYAPILATMGRAVPVQEFFEWYLRQWDFKILRGEAGDAAPATYSP